MKPNEEETKASPRKETPRKKKVPLVQKESPIIEKETMPLEAGDQASGLRTRMEKVELEVRQMKKDI